MFSLVELFDGVGSICGSLSHELRMLRGRQGRFCRHCRRRFQRSLRRLFRGRLHLLLFFVRMIGGRYRGGWRGLFREREGSNEGCIDPRLERYKSRQHISPMFDSGITHENSRPSHLQTIAFHRSTRHKNYQDQIERELRCLTRKKRDVKRENKKL